MGQQDKRRARHWHAAADAADKVPRWLAFRYLFAQQYNRHQPHPCQADTKRRAAHVAQDLVQGMGGSLMAPPPPGLDSDPDWQAWLQAAQALDRDQARSLMNRLVCQQWPHPSLVCQCTMDREGQRRQLALLLGDMEHQQRANDAGWRPGGGPPTHQAAPRRQRRKAKR